jgi:hypothetical protein
MEWLNDNLWTIFLVCMILFIVTTLIMKRIARRFVTIPPASKKFSIFRLEFPGSNAQLSSLVLQMSPVTKSSVRAHLYVDYFFMLAIYPAIAIVCYKTGLALYNSHTAAAYFLFLMAAVQLVAFACDAIENIMLLQKLENIESWTEQSHERFSKIVFYKFMIALFALATVGCCWIYMWLVHLIPVKFVQWVIIGAVIMIAYIIGKAVYKRVQRRAKERHELRLGKQLINA